MSITRRNFLKTASALGASFAFSRAQAFPAAHAWHERRELYPEGVASGDPQADSVLVWTRRPPVNGETAKRLTVEVAEDEKFARVIATTEARPTVDRSCTASRIWKKGERPGLEQRVLEGAPALSI